MIHLFVLIPVKILFLARNFSTKTLTLVMYFCQNLDFPHLDGEQPGNTYDYSPIWVYRLGIINVSEDQLYADLYNKSS